MRAVFRTGVNRTILLALCMTGLSSCYMLNEKHYGDVLGIRSNIERLKAADDKLAARIAALKPLEHALKAEFSREISMHQASILHPSASVLGMSMQNPLLFASGSADISSQGRRMLKRLAKALQAAPDKSIIRMVGHTDPVPLNKSLKRGFIDNWGLSAARAAAVARRIIWSNQVDASRIRIEGRSQYTPVAPNDSFANMAKNRRVEVLVELIK